MSPLSSLTNRVFLGSALLAVLSIGTAVYIVNVRVTSEAESELRRGLEEAARLLESQRAMLFENFTRTAHLIADLPRLKAAMDLDDPPTALPLAKDYRQKADAAVLVLTNRFGKVLAAAGDPDLGEAVARLPAIAEALGGREATASCATAHGLLQVATVPVVIGPEPPEVLGTLTLGFVLDDGLAQAFKTLTDSEIGFALEGRVQAATLPRGELPALEALLGARGVVRATIGGEDYVALVKPLGPPPRLAGVDEQATAHAAQPGAASVSDPPTALVLRSRTQRLRFLRKLHTELALTGVIAVALATLLSYGVARTVTRPLRALSATMREMAATGDLGRGRSLPAPGRWQDEDARLLTATFAGMTEALDRFQREAGQKERLSSLGRLSTVIAHEIRNPLMIVKAALRTLRDPGASADDRREAIADIEGEVARLNRLVNDVLDFARPLRFDYASADVNEVCRGAVGAALAGEIRTEPRLSLDSSLPSIVTDAERLRLALVNVLTNARHSVEKARALAGCDTASDARRSPSSKDDPPWLELITSRAGAERIAIVVRDRGCGIAEEDRPRVFEPYFTTRRGGTGLGLAIAKNIVEGLGGSIAISSRLGAGTEVRLELPARPRATPGQEAASPAAVVKVVGAAAAMASAASRHDQRGSGGRP